MTRRARLPRAIAVIPRIGDTTGQRQTVASPKMPQTKDATALLLLLEPG